MGKRISKKVREEAALLCAIRSSHWAGCFGRGFIVDDLADAAGIGPDALKLAWMAMDEAPLAYGWHGDTEQNECWAEAEALLRTGWTP